jgi:anti-sigma factor (TIGR02949 family)
MIECQQALAELEAYLDGELSEGDRPAMEEHLQGCEHCFERKEFRVQIRAVIRQKCRPAVDLPPGLAERIRLVIRSTELD